MDFSKLILFSILVLVLFTGAVWDLRFRKIPNWLTFPAMAIAVAHHTVVNGFTGFFFSLEGAAVGMAILLPFYLLGGMGAGDSKMLGAVGGLLGPQGVFGAFLFTALLGGIYALVLLACHGSLKKTVLRYKIIFATFLFTRNFIYIPPAAKERKPLLCYGLAIALGTFLSVSFGGRVL
jgi:prepilin peptidase CpaA